MRKMDFNFPQCTIFVWISVLLQTLLLCSTAASLEPYDLLYASGVEAFYRHDYENVVLYMEKALASYTELRQTKVQCRLGCNDQHPFDASFSDLAFFSAVLKRAACLNECMESKVGQQLSVHLVSGDVVQDFSRRVPYNYLQLAYYKLNQLDKASAAAHTFFLANPEHMEMWQNLEHYKLLEGVQESHFQDREAWPHQQAFTSGVKHYDAGDYEKAISFFEEALLEYGNADVECRVLCEGPQKFEEHEYLDYYPSLYKAISDHYTQILICKHECVRDLATRPGRLSPMENYLPLHYDYLQYSYFKVNKIEKALECAWTYLLFHEGDEFITDNIEFYKEALAENNRPQDIRPRQDAERYVRRHQQELKVLLVGSDNLDFVYSEQNYWSATFSREDINRVPSGTAIGVLSSSPSEKRTLASETDAGLREGGPVPYDEVQIVLGSKALNGSQRVLLDGVLSEQECRDLKSAAQTITMAGDGYSGKMSPHTPNEKFEGATVLKALQYGYDGRIPLKSAQLFYEVSEKARRTIESYFMLNSTLYFSYTHLVCRTAIQGQQSHRNDLSHPIHADNCLLDTEAYECWKEPPAYTYRDYSAILYLNGDFDGGEFIFTEMDAKTVTASVKPNCGRMVGFSSGGENPHGVKAVTRGQRCAVAMWFTLDPLFRELERLQADEVMQTLDDEHRMDILNPRDEL
ncbi:prolyl 3-hydroxylase 2-like [Acipenser oxyrinchus oxyrinchus]|uniref:procollagen-proline 3-dioxygenase n=1 Tax=Acipenser oxyrinchus oxyrinchus TaxID=40147 RepID=A0AAD8G794_ACIOX|nr:prolyl 3-hydroxylase 2-like [Acipenser oxyrinchus oxyrinchus]